MIKTDLIKALAKLELSPKDQKNWEQLIEVMTDQEKHELLATVKQMQLERDILATRQSNEIVTLMNTGKND